MAVARKQAHCVIGGYDKEDEMEEQVGPFLIVEVEEGKPHSSGNVLQLAQGRSILGRKEGEVQPDISFTNGFVSKLHAQIDVEPGLFTLTDLQTSKHGTRVNGQRLAKGIPCRLNDGDRIHLAEGKVVLRFYLSLPPRLPGDTWDMPGLELDEGKRGVRVDGEPVQLSPKVYELFCLLWQYRGQNVSGDMIKRKVWPEVRRPSDVSDQNVSTLVYRLRQELGEKYGGLVRPVSKVGYRLDWGR